MAQQARFQGVHFLLSAAQPHNFPPDEGLEIAFAGRSNAGKSSALNALTKKNLAFTGKTPGHTQLINFFTLSDYPHGKLIDLPGYGYAKVSKTLKKNWQELMEAYLYQRHALTGLVLIMDIRHPFQELDLHLLRLAADHHKKIHILLTKADKLKFGARKTALWQADKILQQQHINASMQCFSAKTLLGAQEVYDILTTWLSPVE